MSEAVETNPVAAAAVAAAPEVETVVTTPEVAEVDDQRDVHPDNVPPVDEPDEDGEPPAADEGQADPADEDEEVDYKGRKLKLPKSLNAERMMQADYTRKTTELAGERTAFVASQAAQVAELETMQEDYGKVHSLKAQMALFDAVQWQSLSQTNPQEAQSLWFEREQTKATLAETEGALQAKVQERLTGQREASAKAMQETGQTLARDIKGWNPVLANEIATYGVSCGITPAEIQAMADPRVWKVLHRAMTAEAALKTKSAGDRQVAIQKVEPAKVVTARAVPVSTGLNDRQSQKAWLAERNRQVAARKR
jgi:hypothetical protein